MEIFSIASWTPWPSGFDRWSTWWWFWPNQNLLIFSIAMLNNQNVHLHVCIYLHFNCKYTYTYIYNINIYTINAGWFNFLYISANDHFSGRKTLLSRILCEPHVYLSRGLMLNLSLNLSSKKNNKKTFANSEKTKKTHTHTLQGLKIFQKLGGPEGTLWHVFFFNLYHRTL